jgi:lipooligosaccharide transport system permease protein
MRGMMTRVSYRVLHVWRRDADVYRKTWKLSFLPPFLEPLLYLVAFGVGLAGFVGTVPYRGAAIPYIRFITPAIVAVSVMNNAFFETTYGSFVRMYYQKTFDAMLATPLSLEEVITGEILWGATKALISAAIMLVVIAPFGLLSWPSSLLLLPAAFLGGLAFAAAGMFFTGLSPHIETFNLPVFLFITPMFLLSGTFFPLDGFPLWARILAGLLPLTHLSNLCRGLGLGTIDSRLLLNAAYLAVFFAILYPLALARMRRRLIT